MPEPTPPCPTLFGAPLPPARPPAPAPARAGRWAAAAARSWESARLAAALGDAPSERLLREQARVRARAAAYHRELARGWGVAAG